jgi:hypothetical protein
VTGSLKFKASATSRLVILIYVLFSLLEFGQLGLFNEWAMGWAIEESGFDSWQEQTIIPFSIAPTPSFELTRPPTKWVPGPVSQG